MTRFDLALQTHVCLPPFGEPSEFISEYTCLIRKYTDDSDEPIPVGKMKALYLHVGLAMNARMSLYDVCDDHSDEMHRLYVRLFKTDSYELKRPFGNQFGATGFDVLVLDYVALNPKWRGLKMGLLAVRQLIDILGSGCALVVSEILPLGPAAPRLLRIPRSWVPVHKTKEESRIAARKLRKYFRQVGFNRIGHSAYYALSVANLATPAVDVLKLR